jgi:hypothetical protein
MHHRFIRTALVLALAALLLPVACGKKEGSGSKGKEASEKAAPPLKLIKTELPALKLTLQAPEGAKIEGTNVIHVRHGEVYGIDIQKDIFGAKGDDLIIPFEKKLLKKKLVDQPDLQIWTKDMADQDCVLFALVVTVGPQKYYVQSNGMGMFNRAQVDAMVASARTLAAQ